MSAAMAAEMRRKVGRVERARDRRAPSRSTTPTRSSNAAAPWSSVTSAASVTVPADWNTHDHARRLDAAIRLCGFTPLPLDGAHDAAFAAATIPLGIGLPDAEAGDQPCATAAYTRAAASTRPARTSGSGRPWPGSCRDTGTPCRRASPPRRRRPTGCSPTRIPRRGRAHARATAGPPPGRRWPATR